MHDTHKHTKILKYIEVKEITPKEHSEVEITGLISEEAVTRLREKVLADIAKEFDIDGFRKGHAPTSMVAERVGETKILQEVANEALERDYPALVLGNKLAAVGQPEVRITKLAPGNPIEFSITTAVMPEVTLPDYQNIAKEKREVKTNTPASISEEELENAVLNIRKQHALAKRKELLPESELTLEDIKDTDLAPLDDALVKEFGAFESIDDFREKLRSHLQSDKERMDKEARREALAEAVISETVVAVPRLFVESELDKMIADMEAQTARLGLSFDEYLAHSKKTREEIREEWREEARKRSVLQLALARIAREEDITPPASRVDREVSHILEHYKDAHPENVRAYVETLFTNDLVFSFLETGEKTSGEVGENEAPHEK